MKTVFGYIRVSTAKQGEGVSLAVQKEAIIRYAEQYNLSIVQWFEEKQTAAKQGRPLFTAMMKLLKTGKACGVIIHKIDRSARNLKDWADLGNLIDQGIEVHFAHESLDLQARGGRLSADIQAVIAADYIRNLRQEAIKGLYGRLSQGVWPFHAPAGYLNTGKGKLKLICPEQGPIVKKVFALYATEKYNLRELLPIAHNLGLKSSKRTPISLEGLSIILNNPFYIGILKTHRGTYNGAHEPLISPALFQKVQAILRGKYNQKTKKHEFRFRKLIRCNGCNYRLIPENQKGHVYYRCHTKGCPTKSIRESAIENKLAFILGAIQFLPKEYKDLQELLKESQQSWLTTHQNLVAALKLQKTKVEKQLERLTDCYVEQGLDKETYESRKNKLLVDIKQKDAAVMKLFDDKDYIVFKTEKFLERTKNLLNSFKTGTFAEQRELVEIITSNLSVEGKKLLISMRSPFFELSKRSNLGLCALTPDVNLNKSQVFDLMVESPLLDVKPLTKEKLRPLLDLIFETITQLPDRNENDYEL